MDKITVVTKNLAVALTVGGTAAGYIEVADNTPFYRGALVNLRDANALVMECMITQVVDDGKTIGLIKLIGAKGFTRPDLSAFTVANTTKLHMTSQMLAGYNEENLTHIGYVA
jgi:hypothetical protein